MGKMTQKYARIDPGLVEGLRLIPADEMAQAGELVETGLSSRIFVPGGSTFAPGSFIRFGLTMSGMGNYTMSGIAEWAKDGGAGDDETGLGIRVLEISVAGIETAAAKDRNRSETGPAGHEAAGSPEAQVPKHAVDPAKSILPGKKAVADLLLSLLDMNVAVTDGDPVKIEPQTPSAVCTFVLDDGRPKACWISEFSLVVNIGAALAVIPPEVALEHIRKTELPDNIRENFQEVLNVSASLFNKPDSQHLSLGALTITPDTVPDAVQSMIASASGRSDMKIAIPGYGDGMMTLVESAVE